MVSLRRVMVLGPPGAGKSTFARRLGDALDREVVHLDEHFWEPGWTHPDPEAWRERHRALLEPDAWILDGNYGSTVRERLAAADPAIYLHVPRHVALWRVVKRRVVYHGRSRPDLAAGCPEKLDREFLRYTWRFNQVKRPELEAAIDEAGVDLVVLESEAERAAFLDEVRTA